MKQEVISTFFKWGHRNNRLFITVSLCIAMSVSLAIQSQDLVKLLFYNDEIKLEQKNELDNQATALKAKDFELLFGFNNQTPAPAVSKEIPKTKLNLTLRGALAGIGLNNKDSSAIIQGNNQDKLYLPGETLPGGASLKEIHPDHVIINRNGQLEKLYFPDYVHDTRGLQEYRSPVSSAENQSIERPGFTQDPDDKSLEQRMQELREKLQQASQGIQ